MMDVSEICVRYRQAMDKAEQIGILADLNATTTIAIRDILEENGFIVEAIVSEQKPITAQGKASYIRKKWLPETIEEVAKLWSDGATLDELAQRYDTTLSAIASLQYRHKNVFDRYEKLSAESERVEPAQSAPITEDRAAPMPGTVRPIRESERVSSLHLLAAHAKALQKAATEALSKDRVVDCAYSMGELSQVLIRILESSNPY